MLWHLVVHLFPEKSAGRGTASRALSPIQCLVVPQHGGMYFLSVSLVDVFFYININVKLVQSFAYRSRVPWGLTLSTTSLCEPKVTSVHKGMQLKKCFSL